jgi:hypothetical protein
MSEALAALSGDPAAPVAPVAAPAAAPAAPVAPAGWLSGLSDENLRGNETLSRYQSVDDLAKAHVETTAWARGRIPIPTDEAGFRELGEKLRPESADKYDIPVPEGDDPALAERFKAFAHETGLPPAWAKSVAEFSNREAGEAMSKMAATNGAELKGLELDYGPVGYQARLDAVGNMFAKMGIDNFDAVTALEQSAGAGKALQAFFTMAESTGELAKVDTAGVALHMGTMTAAAAQKEVDSMFGNTETAAKLRDPGSAEAKKYKELVARISKGDGAA